LHVSATFRQHCDPRRASAGAAEVRDLFAPVYRWFTKGFDTADLKALLDHVARA
jgi:hypothetical protein